MTGDEFSKTLFDSARRDAPPAGAKALAVTALKTGAAVKGGAMLFKMFGVVLVAGAAATGAVALRTPTSAPPMSPAPAVVRAEEPAPSGKAALAANPAAPTVARPEQVPSPPARVAEVATPQVSPNRACSSAGHPVHLSLENRLSSPIDLFWIDYECKEQPRGQILPGETYRGISYDTHPFRVRDPESHRVIKELPALSPDPETTRTFIDDSQALSEGPPSVCSTKPNKDMAWMFVDARATPVDVLWVDYQCHEIFYKRLEPGEELKQRTFDTHPWRFRDSASHRLVYDLVPQPLAEWKLTVP